MAGWLDEENWLEGWVAAEAAGLVGVWGVLEVGGTVSADSLTPGDGEAGLWCGGYKRWGSRKYG